MGGKAKNSHESMFYIYDYSFYIYIVKHIFLFSDQKETV